jgi:hypothetical protein
MGSLIVVLSMQAHETSCTSSSCSKPLQQSRQQLAREGLWLALTGSRKPKACILKSGTYMVPYTSAQAAVISRRSRLYDGLFQ